MADVTIIGELFKMSVFVDGLLAFFIILGFIILLSFRLNDFIDNFIQVPLDAAGSIVLTLVIVVLLSPLFLLT